MSLLKKSMIVMAGAVGSAVLGYAYNPLLIAPKLGTAGIAQLSACLYLFFLFSFPLRPVGILIIQEVSKAFNAQNPKILFFVIRNSFKKLAVIGLLLAALLCGAGPFIMSFLKLNSFSLIVITALLVLAALFQEAVRATLQALHRFKEYAFVTVFDPFARIAIGVTLVFSGFHAAGALLGYVGGYISTLLLTLWFLRDLKLNATIHPNTIFPFAPKNLPIWLYSFYFGFTHSIDGLMAKHYWTDHQAGIFVASATLAKLMFVLLSPLSGMALSLMTTAIVERKRVLFVLLKMLAIVFVVGLSMAAVYMLFPRFVIGITYGADFFQAVPILPYSVISYLPMATILIYSNYCLAYKKYNFVYGLMAGAVVHLLLILLFHGTYLELILANMAGGMIELVLAVLASFLQISKAVKNNTLLDAQNS